MSFISFRSGSQDFKRLFFEFSRFISQPIAWKNHHNVFLGCNQKFAEFVGLEYPQQIEGLHCSELPKSFQFLSHLSEQKEKESHYSEVMEDGTLLSIDQKNIPIDEDQGSIEFLVLHIENKEQLDPISG